MTKVVENIAMERPEVPHDHELNVSFRVILSYDLPTDGVMARFDVLLNADKPIEGGRINAKGRQFNAGMLVGGSFLIVPEKGVLNALGFRAKDSELVTALRGLADAIEKYAEKKD